MNPPAFPIASPPRVVSPLLRAMAAPRLADLDPWLAVMNAVALSFILTAAGVFLPTRDHTKQAAPAPAALEEKVDDALTMDISTPEPTDEPPAPEALDSPPTGAEETPEVLDLPPPVEVPVYREMPDLVDPVPVQEPTPRPVIQPEKPRRPEPQPKPTTPSTTRPQPATRSTSGGSAQGVANGVPGGTPGGTGTALKAGVGKGRGTIPEPGYPSWARRDKLTGTVIVSITVRNGVASVKLFRSSGHPSLDQHVVSHVQRRGKWPAGTNGTYNAPFSFEIE